DAAIAPYLLPGGSTSGWAASAYVNPRELPIQLQLPDWNAWLPQVHPLDAFGSAFTSSGLQTDYNTLPSILQPNSASAYQTALTYFDQWFGDEQGLIVPFEGGTWTPALRTNVYSVAQWVMVKQWELNQNFGLEAMPQVPFGAKANPRGWYGS